MQNASGGSPSSSAAGAASRVHEDPYRVTVKSSGRVSAIGRCTPVSSRAVHVSTSKGDVDWIRYDIDALRLGYGATMLILQGLSLGKLFEGVQFHSPDFQLEGSFVFLRGTLSDFYRPPMALTNIVIGKIMEFTGDLSNEELLAALLHDVLLP